jgi:hypothetical protein
MLWLAVQSNRNIVMGSSGSAQNQGGMAAKSLVVPKAQGFAMMAKYIENVVSVRCTSDQAEGKFRYMLGKFSRANAYSLSSSAGVTDVDRAKGIHSMPAKLESMCPHFEVWYSYFGHLQKFNPSSVVTSSEYHDDDHDDVEDGDVGSDSRDSCLGDRIEEEVAAGADCRIDTDVELEAADRVPNAVACGSPVVSPVASTSSRTTTTPPFSRHSGGAAAGHRQSQMQAAQQLEEAKGRLNKVVACTPTSGSSKGQTFDTTYAAVKRDQISMQALIHKESMAGMLMSNAVRFTYAH